MADDSLAGRGQVERRGHFRGRGDGRRRVEVRFRPLAGDDRRWQRAQTDDIGVGGAFVLCGAPPAVGSLLEIEVAAPLGGHTIAVRGEVRRIHSGERRGMGIKFSQLDVESLLALSEYFAMLATPPVTGS